jgi:hypothetical protein
VYFSFRTGGFFIDKKSIFSYTNNTYIHNSQLFNDVFYNPSNSLDSNSNKIEIRINKVYGDKIIEEKIKKEEVSRSKERIANFDGSIKETLRRDKEKLINRLKSFDLSHGDSQKKNLFSYNHSKTPSRQSYVLPPLNNNKKSKNGEFYQNFSFSTKSKSKSSAYSYAEAPPFFLSINVGCAKSAKKNIQFVLLLNNLLASRDTALQLSSTSSLSTYLSFYFESLFHIRTQFLLPYYGFVYDDDNDGDGDDEDEDKFDNENAIVLPSLFVNLSKKPIKSKPVKNSKENSGDYLLFHQKPPEMSLEFFLTLNPHLSYYQILKISLSHFSFLFFIII